MDLGTLLIVAAVFLAPLVWYALSQREGGGGYTLPPMPPPEAPQQTSSPYEEERSREVGSLGGLGTSQEPRSTTWEGPPLSEEEIGMRHPLEGPSSAEDARMHHPLEGPLPAQEGGPRQPIQPPLVALQRVRRRRTRRVVRGQLRSRRGLRQAILVQAVIGPPKALAGDGEETMAFR